MVAVVSTLGPTGAITDHIHVQHDVCCRLLTSSHAPVGVMHAHTYISMQQSHAFMYIHVQPCTPKNIHVHQCTFMYSHVHSCTSMYIHVQPCTVMYINVHSCIAMYSHVHPCTVIYSHVHPCTSTHIHAL